MSVRVRAPETVRLRCFSCGGGYDLSTRANRDRLRGGRDPLCRECRFAPLTVVTDELVEWWRRRMTPEEALPLAELIFGPREFWGPTMEIRRLLDEAATIGYTEDDFAAIMSA